MENKTGVDFLGIKLGDVNNTAKYNSIGENEVRGNSSILPIAFEDQGFVAGESVDLVLNMGAEVNLKGLQFSLNFNQDMINTSDLETNLNGKLSSEDLYYDKTTGRLHVSWDNIDGSEFAENSNLLSLSIKTTKAGKISDLISISDDDNTPEAFSNDQELLKPVLLAQDAKTKQLQFTLFQNKPNPFTGNTQISFYLTDPTQVKLKIMDMTGKVVYEKTDNYNIGLQEITVDGSQLAGPGVYIYSIESDKHSATARMILLQ